SFSARGDPSSRWWWAGSRWPCWSPCWWCSSKRARTGAKGSEHVGPAAGGPSAVSMCGRVVCRVQAREGGVGRPMTAAPAWRSVDLLDLGPRQHLAAPLDAGPADAELAEVDPPAGAQVGGGAGEPGGGHPLLDAPAQRRDAVEH